MSDDTGTGTGTPKPTPTQARAPMSVTTASTTTVRAAPAPLPSPFRATMAVLAGFGLNFFLSGIGPQMLAAMLPGEFPMPADPETPPTPTELGLVLVCVIFSANALLAGVLTGRVALTKPFGHAAILAGIFGLFALYGLDQARQQPGWFAIAFVILPPMFVLLGGLVAERAAKRRAARPPR
jgi:hypothetical protein